MSDLTNLDPTVGSLFPSVETSLSTAITGTLWTAKIPALTLMEKKSVSAAGSTSSYSPDYLRIIALGQGWHVLQPDNFRIIDIDYLKPINPRTGLRLNAQGVPLISGTFTQPGVTKIALVKVLREDEAVYGGFVGDIVSYDLSHPEVQYASWLVTVTGDAVDLSGPTASGSVETVSPDLTDILPNWVNFSRLQGGQTIKFFHKLQRADAITVTGAGFTSLAWDDETISLGLPDADVSLTATLLASNASELQTLDLPVTVRAVAGSAGFPIGQLTRLNAVRGQPFTATLTFFGGCTDSSTGINLVFEAGGLPVGLSLAPTPSSGPGSGLHSGSFTIQGTPHKSGTFWLRGSFRHYPSGGGGWTEYSAWPIFLTVFEPDDLNATSAGSTSLSSGATSTSGNYRLHW